MKANELRIGNYYIDIDDKLTELSGYELYEMTIKENTESLGETEFRPIPLTEEWLVKFGFEKLEGWDDMYYFKIGYFQIYEYNVSGYEYDDFNIKHVHQLQNLYFALTGEELKINDKKLGY
tara:strand:+ start:42 stop:404 length:363 start_codon:yes stop_codon:yes gene_type:complete